HHIFAENHGFPYTPIDPKIVVNSSFSIAALENDENPATSLIALVEHARFYTTT
ncbi:hypothetical protein Tco_0346106, partial [Tanacetum coccineum]